MAASGKKKPERKIVGSMVNQASIMASCWVLGDGRDEQADAQAADQEEPGERQEQPQAAADRARRTTACPTTSTSSVSKKAIST